MSHEPIPNDSEKTAETKTSWPKAAASSADYEHLRNKHSQSTNNTTSTAATGLIKATQGGTVRFDPGTSDNNTSLFTDNLRNCVCICIKGENGKISLSHVDATINPESFDQELEWVGKIQMVFIIAGISPEEALINQYKRYFESKTASLILDTTGTRFCLFSHNGERNAVLESKLSELLTRDNELPAEYYTVSSQEKTRHCILILNNSLTGTNQNPLDLQYDGRSWTELPLLSQQAHDLIESWRSDSSNDNPLFKRITEELALRYTKEKTGSTNTRKLVRGKVYTKCLSLAQNHFKIYLNNYVRYSSLQPSTTTGLTR